MSAQVIADRYAEAIFQAALENGGASAIERIDSELASLATMLKEVPELDRLLKHPVVSLADKKQMVRQLMEGKVHPLTLNLLFLLFDKKRGNLIANVQSSFRKLYNATRKRTTVKVTAALPMEAQQADALRQQLAAQLAQEVELEMAVEPALIGGMTLQIGDSVIDNSLRGRLAALRASLN